MPVIGFHSVILSPDSVNRVTPPTTITAKTKPEDINNHLPTAGGESTGRGGDEAALDEKKRGSKRVDLCALDEAATEYELRGVQDANFSGFWAPKCNPRQLSALCFAQEVRP